MGEISRRTVVGAAWAAPVVLFAVGTPARAASGEDITVVWAPSTVTFGQQATIQVTVPAGSPYVGTFNVNLSVQASDFTKAAYIHDVASPWPAFFDEPIEFQRFYLQHALAAGTYTFIVSFEQQPFSSGSLTYIAELDTSITPISPQATVTIS